MAYVFISAFSKVISTVVAPDKISIDNWCFKLFYRATPMILGVSTVLVCARYNSFSLLFGRTKHFLSVSLFFVPTKYINSTFRYIPLSPSIN